MTENVEDVWRIFEPQNDISLELIIEEISEVDPADAPNIERISSFSNYFCKSESDMRRLLQSIYRKSLFDSKFSLSAIVVISATSSVVVDGQMFINVFVDLLLDDYSRWQVVLQESQVLFMSMAALLAQSFTVLSIDNQPVSRLAEPHVEYQKRLLGLGTTDALQLSVIMLTQNISRLRISLSANRQLVDDLADAMTTRVMGTTANNHYRYWLAIGLHIFKRSFKPGHKFANIYRTLIPMEGVKQIRQAIRASRTKLPSNILRSSTAVELLKLGTTTNPDNLAPQPEQWVNTNGCKLPLCRDLGPSAETEQHKNGPGLLQCRDPTRCLGLSRGRGLPSRRGMGRARGIYLV